MEIFKNRTVQTLLVIIGLGVWIYLFCRFPVISLFTLFLPPVAVINLTRDPRLRRMAISVFVVLWLFVFHYESTRAVYLNSIAQENLPKFKFLFPPAGWIMFFHVNETYSHVEVYGQTGNNMHLIDPHDIFRTRTFGFDNIHRNVLSVVGTEENAAAFCRYLAWRLPSYEDFVIMAVYYPSLVKEPYKRGHEMLYRCGAVQR